MLSQKPIRNSLILRGAWWDRPPGLSIRAKLGRLACSHLALLCLLGLLAACSQTKPTAQTEPKKEPEPSYFKVDPSTAGKLSGAARFTGKKPTRKTIDLSGDPACVESHHGKA